MIAQQGAQPTNQPALAPDEAGLQASSGRGVADDFRVAALQRAADAAKAPGQSANPEEIARTEAIATLLDKKSTGGSLTFAGRMEGFPISSHFSELPPKELEKCLLCHGVDATLARRASLSTQELLKELDTLPTGSPEREQLALFIAERWFGLRDKTRGSDTSSCSLNCLPDAEKVAAIIDLVRAAADPSQPESAILKGCADAFMRNDINYEEWDLYFRTRDLPFPRSEDDARIIERIRAARLKDPIDMISASIGDFRGRLVKEPHSGIFLMSTEAIHAMPHLVERILERPGTQIFCVGKDNPTTATLREKYNTEAKSRVLSIEDQASYHMWSTDYQGLAVIPEGDPTQKPILLDAQYHVDIDSAEDGFARKQAEIFGLTSRKLPLYLEGGNFMVIAPGIAVTSGHTFNYNQTRMGLPPDKVLDVLERCMGKIIELPFTDAATGHVDMDITPITTKNGPAVIVPEVDIQAYTGVATMKRIHSAIQNSTRPYAGSLRDQTVRFLSHYNAELNGVAEKAAILDDIALKLAPHVEIIRVPSLPSSSWRSERGTSSMANALFFVDGNNESNLIVPEYPDAPLSETVKAEYLARLTPHVDHVSFVSVVSPTLNVSVANLDGVFHCMAPQLPDWMAAAVNGSLSGNQKPTTMAP